MLVARLTLEAAEGGARLRGRLTRENDREIEIVPRLSCELLEHLVVIDRRGPLATLVLVPKASAVGRVLDRLLPRPQGARRGGALARGGSRAAVGRGTGGTGRRPLGVLALAFVPLFRGLFAAGRRGGGGPSFAAVLRGNERLQGAERGDLRDQVVESLLI